MSPGPGGPIGLLGGSFDPIHVGHLRLASEALSELGLAQVRFVPAGYAWQKGAMTAAVHRAWMVGQSIKPEARFALDPCELQRTGPSYTVDTLGQLRAGVGPALPLVLLIGADQFERLDTWHRWEQLAGLAHIAVARRLDHALRLAPALQAFRAARLQPASEAALRPAGALIELTMAPLDCSSTQIRALVREGGPSAESALRAMLAPGVLDYIRQQRLYA